GVPPPVHRAGRRCRASGSGDAVGFFCLDAFSSREAVPTSLENALAERRRDHHAALGPEIVEAAFEPRGRVGAEIALVDLAIVSNAAYHGARPVTRQSQFAPEV